MQKQLVALSLLADKPAHCRLDYCTRVALHVIFAKSLPKHGKPPTTTTETSLKRVIDGKNRSL